jgi:hypothetical protein
MRAFFNGPSVGQTRSKKPDVPGISQDLAFAISQRIETPRPIAPPRGIEASRPSFSARLRDGLFKPALRFFGVAAAAACILVPSLSCTTTTGGSAEQGNARVMGAVAGSPYVDVRLVTEDFNPFNPKSGAVIAGQTDCLGHYSFDSVPYGNYYLYAFDHGRREALLAGPVAVVDTETNFGTDSLRGAAVVEVVENDPAGGAAARYYIKGVSEATAIREQLSRLVKITGVPSGVRDVMRCESAAVSTAGPTLYAASVEILPDDSITVSFHNRPPRITSVAPIPPATVLVDTVYSFKIIATDPDSNAVTYAMIASVPLADYSFDAAAGILSWTPRKDDGPAALLRFTASDDAGAASFFKWDVAIREASSIPPPEAPGGSTACTVGTAMTYTVGSKAACSSNSYYRFSWGDGDTSKWIQAASDVHTWRAPGAYQVRQQIRCDDVASPSPWGSALAVTVVSREVPATETPSIAGSLDTVTLPAPVTIRVFRLSCSQKPLYRYYLDGEIIREWTPDTSFEFTSGAAGTYVFYVQAWCDTPNAAPSAKSKPYTAYVRESALPAPALSGDTAYTTAPTVSLSFKFTSDTVVNGTRVMHRFSMYNKASAGGSTVTNLGYIIMKDTCTAGPKCIDTIQISNGDTTRWLYGGNFSLVLLKPSLTFFLSVQSWAEGYAESAWTYQNITQR